MQLEVKEKAGRSELTIEETLARSLEMQATERLKYNWKTVSLPYASPHIKKFSSVIMIY